MEGRALIKHPVGVFSEGACLSRGRVTRRQHRAVPIAIGTWYPAAAGPEICHVEDPD
jgi:hypothetical protein